MRRPATAASPPAAFGLVAILGLLGACHAGPFPRNHLLQNPSPGLRGPSRYVDADWSFSITASTCVARARHPAVELSATVGPARRISLSLQAHDQLRVSSRAAAAELAFDGEGGSWQVRATRRGLVVQASLSPNKQSLDDLLALLDGGRFSARTASAALPGMTIPDAGVAGRDWYGCAAARLARDNFTSPANTPQAKH